MVLPLELGDLPYRDHRIIEDFLGKTGIDELGDKEWEREVTFAVGQLKKSVIADYVVLGGGKAKKLGTVSLTDTERGHNRNAFLGGVRLWQNRRPYSPSEMANSLGTTKQDRQWTFTFSDTARPIGPNWKKIGRRTAADQARQERKCTRSRQVFKTNQSAAGPDRDQSASARLADCGDCSRASGSKMPRGQTCSHRVSVVPIWSAC